MGKKSETLKVTGWFCLAIAILIGALSVYFITTGKELGLMLLAMGVCLGAVGIVNLAASRKQSG